MNLTAEQENLQLNVQLQEMRPSIYFCHCVLLSYLTDFECENGKKKTLNNCQFGGNQAAYINIFEDCTNKPITEILWGVWPQVRRNSINRIIESQKITGFLLTVYIT